jgi:hypothetical protein
MSSKAELRNDQRLFSKKFYSIVFNVTEFFFKLIKMLVHF